MPGLSRDNWPEPEDYIPLGSAGRAGLAWEWLRRDPGYHELAPSAWRRTPQGVTIIEAAPCALRERWGCLFIGDARQATPECPMLWDTSLDMSILRLEARERVSKDIGAFDIGRWAPNAVIVKDKDSSEHLLLHRGEQRIHLHIMSGTLLEGPVLLHFDTSGASHVEPVLATLQRFMHLYHRGEWIPERALSGRVTRRTLLALRAHDARAAGASIRDIGIMLFGRARVEAEWRDPGESLKSQCRRLIALARKMAHGGYKDLLR